MTNKKSLLFFLSFLVSFPAWSLSPQNPVTPFLGCYDAIQYNSEPVSPSTTSYSEIRLVPQAEYFSRMDGVEIPSIRVTGRMLGPQGDYEKVLEVLVGEQPFVPFGSGAQVTYEDVVFNKLSQAPFAYGYQLRLSRQPDGTLIALKIEIECNCGEKLVLRPRPCNL